MIQSRVSQEKNSLNYDIIKIFFWLVNGKDRSDPQMGAYGHNLSKNDGLGISSSKITASIRKKLVKLRNHSI